MFNYTFEEIKKAEKVYFQLENRLENLAKEFGMTQINGKTYVLDAYSFDFYDNEDGQSLTDIYVSNIDNKEDSLSFPFPTSWIWDEPGAHENAYFEWKDKCPKIKYRPQRGTYEESMREMKWFHTKEAMFEYIVKNNEFIANTSSLFLGDDAVYDKRNSWSTRCVMCNNYAGKELKNPVCVGLCSIEP